MSSEWDKNTRGIGVLLRFSGVVVPVVVFLALFFGFERGSPGVGVPEVAVTGVFRAIAFPWSWPYDMFSVHPFSFGAVAVISIIAALLLFVRRDRRGWIATLVFSFVFGWLASTIIGQAQGF